MTSSERRGFEEGFGDLVDAMADIPDILSFLSSDSSEKLKVEELNYKDELRSIASAMNGINTDMELQNNPMLMKLKAEADLIILLEAVEAKVEAVRSKPNPAPPPQQYLTSGRELF